MARWALLIVLVACTTLADPVQGQVGTSLQGCPDPVPGTGRIVGTVREASTQVFMGFVDVRLIPASRGTGALVRVL